MITFPIKMLQLPNFGQMTTSMTSFESPDKNLLMMSWTETMTS